MASNSIKTGNYLIPIYAVFSNDQSGNKERLLLQNHRYRINSVTYFNDNRVVIIVESEYGLQVLKYYTSNLSRHFKFVSIRDERKNKIMEIFG